MAMRFAQAQRAENPDLAKALAEQTAIANQLKAAEMQRDAQRETGYLQAGTGLAEAAPEGTFTNAWDIGMGNPSAATIGADSAAGGGAELLAEQAIADGLLAQGGTTAAAAAPEIAAAAAAAPEAAALTGASGAGAGLAALGPVGWAALAALAGSQLF